MLVGNGGAGGEARASQPQTQPQTQPQSQPSARPVAAAPPRPAPRSDQQPEPPAPEPRPAPPVASSGGDGGVHVVKSGETLGEISQSRLGTVKRWKEIASLNGIEDPGRLRVGQKLRLPGGAGARPEPERRPGPERRPESGQAAPPAGATYTVKEGDSLWKIAARELGGGERWQAIAAANPELDPDRLEVGMRLALPAAGPQRTTVASAPARAVKGRVR